LRQNRIAGSVASCAGANLTVLPARSGGCGEQAGFDVREAETAYLPGSFTMSACSMKVWMRAA
jgi:hypothetical protein